MSATAADHSPAPGEDDEPSGTALALGAAHAEARQRAETGDLTGARTLLEDALAIGEVRLGYEHPRLAPLMVDLATVARGLGNLTEALTQLRRAYAIVTATGGPEHPTSLSIEGRLAAVMYRLGEPTEAYDWHLADVGSRVLGAEHPAVKGAQQRLAAVPPAPGAVEAALAQAAPAWAPDATPTQSWDRQEPGLAPTYAPSAPGVYQRRALPAPYAAPAQQPPVDIWQAPDDGTRRRRGHGGGGALVAGLGAAALVAAAVVAFQLFGPSSHKPDAGSAPGTTQTAPPTSPTVAATSPAPAVTGSLPPAPGNVTLVDNGGEVILTWTDPSDGKVPFIVAGGRVGSASSPQETVPAGRTTWKIFGLNIDHDYCYTVAAVWSSDTIVASPPACTHRLSTSGVP